MITMLDQPIPDLPFAYQENLIYFAYAAAFGFGTYLVATWVMEFKDVFRYV